MRLVKTGDGVKGLCAWCEEIILNSDPGCYLMHARLFCRVCSAKFGWTGRPPGEEFNFIDSDYVSKCRRLYEKAYGVKP
jgi:hypothetical protein